MEFRVDEIGLTEFEVRFRAVKDFKDEVVETVNHAATAAGAFAYDHAPNQSGRLRSAIYTTPARYRPGGAGGGGTYVAEVGVHETMAPHAKWLLSGTGIYGAEGHPIFPSKARGAATSLFQTVVDKNGKINQYSRRKGADRFDMRRTGGGAFLTFQKQGEPRRFRRQVEGQPAQTAWWVGAQEIAETIIRQKVART